MTSRTAEVRGEVVTETRADVLVESEFLRLCRRRSRVGSVVALAGTVALAAVGRRLRAPWVVPVSVAVVGLMDAANGPAGTVFWGDRPAESCAALQAEVDALARAVGTRPPTVVIAPPMMSSWMGTFVWPVPRIWIREDCVPEPGEPVPDWLAGVLAHEIGHCYLADHALQLFAGWAPLIVPVVALRMGAGRRWATLSAASVGLVLLPGLWASRWAERGADEVARLLGYGPALLDLALENENRAARRKSTWRSVVARRPRVLATHPTRAELIARMRSADGNPGRPYLTPPLG